MKIETGLEKKNYWGDPPPPLQKFLSLWLSHPPGISNPFRGGGGMDISGTTHFGYL